MARKRRARSQPPGCHRIPAGEHRPTCPRCKGPVFFRSHDRTLYVCPGCCGFTDVAVVTVSLAPDDADSPHRRYSDGRSVKHCYGRTVQLLERALGPELAGLLRKQAKR